MTRRVTDRRPGLRGFALVAGLAVLLAGCGADTTTGPDRPSAAASASDPAASDRAALEASTLPPCPRSTDAVPVDGGLPDLALACLGKGPEVTLSGVRGTPLVVNVWASWCPPCAAEMPLLEQVRRETEGEVRFLGVDLLDQRGAALAAAEDFGMGFPSVQDPDGETRQALKVPGPPVTLLVDADGTVVHRQVGEITSAQQLRDLLAEHLGVGS